MEHLEHPSQGEWMDLITRLLARRDELERWNGRHVKIYKYLGYIIAIAMPILAALITYLSTAPEQVSTLTTSLIGLLLTFITVLNAVLKPGERFLGAVQLSHDLVEFKTNVEVELRLLSRESPINLKNIYQRIQLWDRHLSAIGESMARGTLSTNVPEERKNPTDLDRTNASE